MLKGVSGVEHRVAHDEHTRIDRPAHVGDRIEAFVDDSGRAVLIRNIDQGEGSQEIKVTMDLGGETGSSG